MLVFRSTSNDGPAIATTGHRLMKIFFLLIIFFLQHRSVVIVNGQRIKEGCYDAEPITCKTTSRGVTPDNNYDSDVNVEEVCRKIIWDVLPQNDQFILFQQDEHYSYLNSIEASTEFCSEIRVAYSQCIFCNTNLQLFELSRNIAQITSCSNRPSQEEILVDNINYPFFQTQQDIMETCQELDVAYNTERPLLAGVKMPSTISLNLRQNQIKHLCPNQCIGGCFDLEAYPPSCDPDAYTAAGFERDDTLDVYSVCDQLLYLGFYYDTRPEIVMNISNHIDYLSYFAGNTTFCDQARQSYSHCLWCADSLCFAEPNRPTCQDGDHEEDEEEEEVGIEEEGEEEATAATTTTITITNDDNTTTTMTTNLLDANTVCQGIYQYFVDMTFPDDLYNYTKHATNFLMGSNHPFCPQAKKMYSKCYWCAPRTNVPVNFCTTGSHCTLLQNVSTIVPENFKLSSKISSSTLLTHPLITEEEEDDQSTTTTTENCDAIYQEWITDRIEPYTIQGCYEDIFLASRCGEQFCNTIEEAEKFDTPDGYLGADTDAKKKTLIWVSRVSSFFSFCGGCYILQDILKDKKLRKLTYHQLLVAMASFDLVTALAWVFATAPIPSDEGFYIEGAIGTDVTCGFQAFFVQLGFTSVFYNISLAAYYVLVVVYSWKEFQLVEMKKHFHILPLILGFGMAFAAIPVYDWYQYGCHIRPGADLWASFVFVCFPIGSAILGISTCLLMVYFKVRGQAAASKKWSSGGKASQLEQAVFWQCVSYALAFYISWPILFALYMAEVGADGPFGLSVVIALVSPMQGFNNFCVYIRPKLNKKKKKKKKSGVSSSSVSSTSWMNNSSNPINRLLQLGRRGTTALGLSGNVDGSQWESTLDPSAAIAQRTSRISLFSRKTPKNERQPSGKGPASTRPSGGKPSTAAMAQWGLQEPPATGPSAAAMAQWGLQEPATPPKASAAAMAQWGLQEPAAKVSTASMAQWGLQDPAPSHQSPAATTNEDLGAAKMEDVDSTNGDRVEDDLEETPILEHEGKQSDCEGEEEGGKGEGDDKQGSCGAAETVGTIEDTANSEGSSENAGDRHETHDTIEARQVRQLPEAGKDESGVVVEDKGNDEDDGICSGNEVSAQQIPPIPGPESNKSKEIESKTFSEGNCPNEVSEPQETGKAK